MLRKTLTLLDLTVVPRIALGNRSLLWQMTRRNIEIRCKGSALGLVWSFVQPLMMLVVCTFVFSVVFKARWGVEVAGGESKESVPVFFYRCR